MGRSCYLSSLIIFLLAYLIITQRKRDISCILHGNNLESLVVSIQSNQTKFISYQPRVKPNTKESIQTMVPALKATFLVRLLNFTMAANLIMLSNDISTNSGLILNLPVKGKGLGLMHLNICSLQNKLEEVHLFCDMHKPHVLSLNETWLYPWISAHETRQRSARMWFGGLCCRAFNL